MPSGTNMDPQQIRQAWRTVRAVDTHVGGIGQCGFSLLRVTWRRPGPGHPEGREQQAHGNQADRQRPVGRSERRNSRRNSHVMTCCSGAMVSYVPVCDDGDQVSLRLIENCLRAGQAAKPSGDGSRSCGEACHGKQGCVFWRLPHSAADIGTFGRQASTLPSVAERCVVMPCGETWPM